MLGGVHEAQVGAQGAEGLGPARGRVGVQDERVLVGIGVERDASEQGGVGERLDVVLGAHLGVHELTEHGQAEADEETEDDAERDVPDRPGRHGGGVELGVLDHGHFDRTGPVHVLELGDGGG